MKLTHGLMVAVLAATLFPACASAQENNVPPEGFVAIFNGKDLSGWRGMGHFSPYQWAELTDEARAKKTAADNEDLQKHWRVEDGELVNDGHGVYATTEKEYGSFELWIDYKTVAKADSGIYLRGTPQVQIWDTTEAGGKWKIGAKEGSGSLWNNKKGGNRALVLADKPFGEWNRFHIKMVGDVVTVHLNDKLVVDAVPLENFWDAKRPLPERGPIQLQTHGGEIRWRNIFLREIDPASEKSE